MIEQQGFRVNHTLHCDLEHHLSRYLSALDRLECCLEAVKGEQTIYRRPHLATSGQRRDLLELESVRVHDEEQVLHDSPA